MKENMKEEMKKHFDNNNKFIETLQSQTYVSNTSGKEYGTLEVLVADGEKYIYKSDYDKYLGGERISTDFTSNEELERIDLVKVTQEEIDEICHKWFFKAEMVLMKTKERYNISLAEKRACDDEKRRIGVGTIKNLVPNISQNEQKEEKKTSKERELEI